MRLLISVRSAEEAGTALTAGADIIDAKEPSLGSLGAVSASVLLQICQRIPADRPLSVALGDVTSAPEVLQGIATVPRSLRPATYLKLGFAGVTEPETVHQLLRLALEMVAGESIAIVAVAYADAVNAVSLPPEILCHIAQDAGVLGILFDTYQKSDGNLLTWLDQSRLVALLAMARAGGLLTAVAGGLGLAELSTVRELEPHIVGFRGAACEHGREGELSENRIRLIRRRLSSLDSGFVHPHFRPSRHGGETPGVSAILD
jgi:(5-formylfuran-3-yl)methyl phosphate synthase